MTGVHHLGADRYRVTVFESWDPLAKRQRQRTRVIRADDIKAARRMANKVAGEMIDEIADGVAKRGTVAGAVSAWLEEAEQRLSPSTMKGYRQIGGEVVKRFGRMKIDELKPSDVRTWYARLLKDGMTPETLAHYHSVMRIICNRAWNDGDTLKPATKGVGLPSVVEKDWDLPTDQAMMFLLAHGTADLGVAVRLAAATGMRRGELVALRWSDLRGREFKVSRALIEADRRVIEKSTKGKRTRMISLDYQTMRMLVNHRRAQVSNAAQFDVSLTKRADRRILADLEADPKGLAPYPPTWFSHGWSRMRKAAAMEWVTLHQVRHWHATMLLDSGLITIADLADRLGHADPAVTMRIYVHSRKERRKIAAVATGQAMKALPPVKA